MGQLVRGGPAPSFLFSERGAEIGEHALTVAIGALGALRHPRLFLPSFAGTLLVTIYANRLGIDHLLMLPNRPGSLIGMVFRGYSPWVALLVGGGADMAFVHTMEKLSASRIYSICLGLLLGKLVRGNYFSLLVQETKEGEKRLSSYGS